MDYQTIYDAMESRYQSLTGLPVNRDSELGIRMQVLAGELYGCYGELEHLSLQMFPQTATGLWLERHAAQHGLSRKQTGFARGSVRFSRTGTGTQDLTIPSGTAVGASSSSGVCWITEEDVVLPASASGVDASVRCTVSGESGNVGIGVVDTIISAITGVTSVTNPAAITGGSQAESDDSLRSRLMEQIVQPSSGVGLASFEQMVQQVDGVHSAKAVAKSATLAMVYLTDYHRTTSAEVLSAAEQVLIDARPLGMNVTSAIAETVNLDVQVNLYTGAQQDKAALIAQGKKILETAIYELKVGQSFNPYVTGGLLYQKLEGVSGVDFVSPSAILRPQSNQVYAPGTLTVHAVTE